MREPARQLLVLAPLLVALGVWAGCGDAEQGEPDSGAFPLRVLQSMAGAAGDEHTVFVDELDSLDEWWMLRPGAGGAWSLSPAGAAQLAAGPAHDAGTVVLPPGTALLRRVELSRSTEHALTVRLRGRAATMGEACSNLALLPARGEAGEELLDVLAAEQAQLDRMAARLLDADRGVAASLAAWRQTAGAADFALARQLEWVDVAPPQGSSRWIALAAFNEPIEIDRVRVSISPRLHFGSDSSTQLPEERSEIAVRRMRIAGDSRIAAFVPARRVLSLPIDVPPGAVDMVLGACPDPAFAAQLPAGERVTTLWSVRAQPGNHLLGEIGESVSAERPVGFTDHILTWPPGLQGAVTLEFGVAGVAGMVFGQPRVRGPEQPGAPSLLFVSIDTLRPDHLGFLGYDRPTSPYLDSLAARATVFTDVTAAASYTLPAHASMFTGLFPPRHLALDTSDRVNAQRTPTLAALLSAAGFYTAAFTGGGFVSGDYGFDTGFDRYGTVDPMPVSQAGAEPDGQMLDSVSAWIRRQGRRPWFAFLHTYSVHDYAPAAQDLALFERSPPPAGFDPYDLIDRRDLKASPPTRAELDRLVELYDASIHGMDRRLAALLEPLRNEGLLDDTWLVITSDHGEEFFEHGQLRHRGTLYRELVQVPLLIVPPAHAATTAGAEASAGAGAAATPIGRRIDEPVCQVDLFSTVLELLGQPVPAGGDGRSLAPCVRGEAIAAAPTPLYSHLDRSLGALSSLREGVWKLVHVDPSRGAGVSAEEWQLFDLEHDARELHAVGASSAAELDRLRARLAQVESALHAQPAERSRFEPDEDLLRRLAALGYVESAR